MYVCDPSRPSHIDLRAVVMIVGSGLLANAFAPAFSGDEDFLVFASGVSNSSETRHEAFLRERMLLQATLSPVRRLIYFSSCAVANASQPSTPYLQHKREMERMVLGNDGIVLRLPQVVGKSSNPNTLTNFLFDRIDQGLPFELWTKVERNLIDIDDVASIATFMVRRGLLQPGRPESIAAAESIPMLRIVSAFEEIIGRKAVFQAIEKALPFPIESALCQTVAVDLGIRFDETYLTRLLRKYYSA